MEERGINEKCIDSKTGKTLVKIDPKYFRLTEVDLLLSNSTKAEKELGWKPKISFHQLVEEMVTEDMKYEKNI